MCVIMKSIKGGGEVKRILKNPEVNKRIRELRETLNVKQGVYAADLSITQGALSEIENMRNNPSDRLIRDICLRDNVNKEWLLEGKEPIFLPVSRTQEIAGFMGEVINAENAGSFKQQLIHVLAQLNEDQWQVLADMYQLLLKEQSEQKSGD
ncbi:helix-turn-helix domain-containing protein [Holdemania massiliensis]|uniref:Helix-turn-helix domain-containing protein n=1 Tax=Holdemania massiliensis TaxID=1468449 RepID=A0A6N7S8N6_9FIRM|nr:helix-turn-helix domain-containing protein [Holdemania massiliensis]MSA90261.1 helix-turn-helix domain-containing protein [Holdemania massiliensis]MSB79067.1 helix-turn-helix domain-containing protein [Holdemania massiliensis]MSC33991.1 helix-turn-helix domain-containing protein [Holdemania massiliensis]MSC40381.1 helix-turn-helix domain-containing protein [Holdemania massiliensis]